MGTTREAMLKLVKIGLLAKERHKIQHQTHPRRLSPNLAPETPADPENRNNKTAVKMGSASLSHILEAISSNQRNIKQNETYFQKKSKYDKMRPVARLWPRNGKGGETMLEVTINFLLAVAASVIGTYICKWLDSHKKGN